MSTVPDRFENVTVQRKANIYFDGKVVSHTVVAADGSRKTLGLIYPGTFQFNTDAPERMDITSGSCRVRLAGQTDWIPYPAGMSFRVAGKSSFEIIVEQGLTEYVCSFE